MQHLQPNITLQGGKYRIERVLGQGGFGNTYFGYNTIFNEPVAIKEFFMQGVNDRNASNGSVSVSIEGNRPQFEEQREKFKKEALRIRKLDNPHIIKVHDLFEENGTAYYVMDYVDGENLAERLKRTGKPMTETEVRELLPQILDALKTVHDAGIWHLDLKPANIMVDKSGNVKLIDFGASKQLNVQKGGATTSTAISYTNGYAPREQMEQNFDKFGPWTDFYALGATLYTLLTNKRPPLPTDIDDDITEDKHIALPFSEEVGDEMKQLILWMMKTNRNQRPQATSEIENFHNAAQIEERKDSGFDDEETIIAKNDIKDEKTIEQLIHKAQAGDAKSQNELGDCYYFGKGVEENYDKAFDWFKKSAEQGYPAAQFNLGLCFYYGKGVKEDTDRALEFLKQSAEQGHSVAQEWLEKLFGSESRTKKTVSYGKKDTHEMKDTNGWHKVLAFVITFIPFIILWSVYFHNIISFLGERLPTIWASYFFWWLGPVIALFLWYPLRGLICYIINRNNRHINLHDIIITEFSNAERNWKNWIPFMIFNVIVLLFFVYFNVSNSKTDHPQGIGNLKDSIEEVIDSVKEIVPIISDNIISDYKIILNGDAAGYPISITLDVNNGQASGIYKNIKYGTSMYVSGTLDNQSLKLTGYEDGKVYRFFLFKNTNDSFIGTFGAENGKQLTTKMHIETNEKNDEETNSYDWSGDYIARRDLGNTAGGTPIMLNTYIHLTRLNNKKYNGTIEIGGYQTFSAPAKIEGYVSENKIRLYYVSCNNDNGNVQWKEICQKDTPLLCMELLSGKIDVQWFLAMCDAGLVEQDTPITKE